MSYGIRFIVTSNEEIKNVEVIRNPLPMIGFVNEFAGTEDGTFKVTREILLTTKREYTQEEAEKTAKEWYGKFREKKLLKVLEGD